MFAGVLDIPLMGVVNYRCTSEARLFSEWLGFFRKWSAWKHFIWTFEKQLRLGIHYFKICIFRAVTFAAKWGLLHHSYANVTVKICKFQNNGFPFECLPSNTSKCLVFHNKCEGVYIFTQPHRINALEEQLVDQKELSVQTVEEQNVKYKKQLVRLPFLSLFTLVCVPICCKNVSEHAI